MFQKEKQSKQEENGRVQRHQIIEIPRKRKQDHQAPQIRIQLKLNPKVLLQLMSGS